VGIRDQIIHVKSRSVFESGQSSGGQTVNVRGIENGACNEGKIRGEKERNGRKQARKVGRSKYLLLNTYHPKRVGVAKEQKRKKEKKFPLGFQRHVGGGSWNFYGIAYDKIKIE